jgi:hypothetical protein
MHTRDQAVFATFRLENGCLAFPDVEPVLPERIDDVWLVRDENVLLPLSGALANKSRNAFARRLFSSGVTTRPPSDRCTVASIFLKPASTRSRRPD